MIQENKYILNKNQVDTLKTVYKQIILDGLSEVGLTKDVEKEILENSDSNFTNLIKDTQKILTEIGVMEEIRLELKAEEEAEKAIAELCKEPDTEQVKVVSKKKKVGKKK